MAYDLVFFVGVSYALNTLFGFFMTGFVFVVIVFTKLRKNRTFQIIALLCVVDIVQLFCFAVSSVVVMLGEREIYDRAYIELFAGALIQGGWISMAYLELALAVNRLAVITAQKWMRFVEKAILISSVPIGVYFMLCLLVTPTHQYMDFEILTWKTYQTTNLSALNTKATLLCSVIPMALNVIVYVLIFVYIATKKVVTRWNEIRFLVAVIGGFLYTLFLACFYHYWYKIFNDNRTVWIIQHHVWIFLFTFACSLHLCFNSELRRSAIKVLKRTKKLLNRTNKVYTIDVNVVCANSAKA